MTEERRLVTVLFADVTGSTAMGEALDPEDVRSLLSRYYAIAQEVVAEHGGTIQKFIGDAVMAIFGLPQAHGDDARRALSTALDLRDRVQADPQLGARLPIRIGVNTGEVVAWRDNPAHDFLITGDSVNVAARLEQAAEPWGILCGQRTAQAAAGAFSFSPPLDIDAKGKSAPVRALRVLARIATAATARIPLIGRQADLQQLELVASRAFEERRPFLVSVIAPAGIGKTRLLEEFLLRLPSLAPAATIAIAQCLPYGQRLTYWPLRAVLLRLIGASDDAEPSAIRAAILSWLRASGVDSPERVAELLAATVGIGESEVTDRSAQLVAWRTALESAARRSPLVLVFEDLHWSSDSLLDLFEFVMQPRGDAPVFMVALTRPELLDRRPAWGGGRRNYVSLALEPLSDRSIASLVEHLLESTSPEIAERIVKRAEGNPFFAGELIRSLVERVPNLHDPGAVERALSSLPDTVQATVLARLDLLAVEERRVIQLGAVFGRTFRAAGVVALDPALRGVDQATDALLEKDLVRASGADGFAFRHILIREVAYQTLTRLDGGRLHAAAARWLEDGAAGREDALAELIAYHYREAATLSPPVEPGQPEAIQVRRQAARWLARAAGVAAAGAASVEAARHLRSAIELAAPADLPELYERLGDLLLSGREAIDAYGTALRLCRAAGRPPDQELRVFASLLSVHMRFATAVAERPSEEEMQRLMGEGEALVARARDVRAIGAFRVAVAFHPFWRRTRPTESEIATAEASARQGLAIAESLDATDLRSAALDALASGAMMRGAWAEVRAFSRVRLSFQDRLNMIERIDAHSMVAWASVMLGDLKEVDRVSAAGLTVVQPGQVPGPALHLVAWRCNALRLLGRWDEVLQLSERAYRLWTETGRDSAGYAIHGFIAALDVARARRDQRLIDRYREVVEEIMAGFSADSPVIRWRPYLTGDLEALQPVLQTGLEIATARGVHMHELVICLCVDRGRPPDPQTLQRIAGFATTHGLLLLEAQARRALGVALQNPDELAQALTLWERAGAVPYAARARCERARLTGDKVAFREGMDALRTLNDVDQLARFEGLQGSVTPL